MRGRLILIGGSKNRKKDDGVFRSMLSIANPKKILIIPSAAPISISTMLGTEYLKLFKDIKAGCQIRIIDVRNEDEWKREENSNYINEVDFVFFTGGNQVLLNKILKKSILLHVISRRFHKKELDIAGTSAGASVMGGIIIYGENELEESQTQVFCEYGFGLLPKIIIDSHVFSRKRIYRIAKSLIANPGYRGLGLAEDSGVLLMKDDKDMKVFGKNPVVKLSVTPNEAQVSSKQRREFVYVDNKKIFITYEKPTF